MHYVFKKYYPTQGPFQFTERFCRSETLHKQRQAGRMPERYGNHWQITIFNLTESLPNRYFSKPKSLFCTRLIRKKATIKYYAILCFLSYYFVFFSTNCLYFPLWYVYLNQLDKFI
jgi:hypothetical protein